MPKLILLPATGTADDAGVFATGLAAARLFDGHLVALHVRADIRREIATMASADLGVGAGLEPMITALEADADARLRNALDGWNSFREVNGVTYAEAPVVTGVTAEWRQETGNEADWIADHGRTTDLTVSGRYREGGLVAMDILEAALMDSGRPLLVATESVPPGGVVLDGPIAIAWKNTRESAKAVAAALPFIVRARSVVVLSVQEDADSSPDPSPARLARSLRWHNPNVEVRAVRPGPDGAVDTLLEEVKRAGAGLLVMGGYGHTRLREAVFGGFTRAVLESAPIPVLMAH